MQTISREPKPRSHPCLMHLRRSSNDTRYYSCLSFFSRSLAHSSHDAPSNIHTYTGITIDTVLFHHHHHHQLKCYIMAKQFRNKQWTFLFSVVCIYVSAKQAACVNWELHHHLSCLVVSLCLKIAIFWLDFDLIDLFLDSLSRVDSLSFVLNILRVPKYIV